VLLPIYLAFLGIADGPPSALNPALITPSDRNPHGFRGLPVFSGKTHPACGCRPEMVLPVFRLGDFSSSRSLIGYPWHILPSACHRVVSA